MSTLDTMSPFLSTPWRDRSKGQWHPEAMGGLSTGEETFA
jgi:hypothetical protein